MRLHIAYPRYLDRFLRSIVLCFLREKNLTMSQFATDAIFRYDLYARCRHRRLLKNYAQLRTVVDFIVLSIQLVFMVLGASYSRVLYNN